MNIAFNPYISKNLLYNLSQKQVKYDVSHKTQNMGFMNQCDTVNFGANICRSIIPEKIGMSDITKIVDEKEFDEVFQRLKNSKYWQGNWWDTPDVSKYEQALIPYIGASDISFDMNYFMREGKSFNPKKIPNNVMEDFIKVFDFGLQELDKKYGNYSGIVYRHGMLESSTKNYVSTSRNINGAAQHMSYIRHENPFATVELSSPPYYVIFTKHGHKLENLQNRLDYGNDIYFRNESEILLNPNSKFEEITLLSPQMEKIKKEFVSAIKFERGKTISQSADIRFCKEV